LLDLKPQGLGLDDTESTNRLLNFDFLLASPCSAGRSLIQEINTQKHQTNILENRTKQKPQRGFFLIKREHKKTQVPLITLTVLESILFNAIQFIKNPNKILSSFFFFYFI
jgi:hypothetical protein